MSSPTDILIDAIAEALRPVIREELQALEIPNGNTEYLKPKEAARELGVEDKKVYAALHLGELKHLRVGRSYRIRREDLEAWAGRWGD